MKGYRIVTANRPNDRNAQSVQNNNFNTVGRNAAPYPGADYKTIRLVEKFHHRMAESQSLNKATSSDIMQDIYRSAPQNTSAKMPAANVNELIPGYDQKYSQYSNVNVQAVKAAQEREAMNRKSREGSTAYPIRREAAQNSHANGNVQRKNPANTAKNTVGSRPTSKPNALRPTTKVTAQNSMQNAAKNKKPGTNVRQNENAKRNVPAKRSGAVNVRFGSPDAMSQMAESGPREALYRKVPFPKLAIMVLMLSLIFFLMVHSIVKNFEYQREIAELESQLDTLNERATELKLELEERDDLADLERRAEEIGMIKSGKVEEKFISLDNSDIIENFGEDEKGYGSLTTMLSAVSRQLSKFLGGE